MYTTIMEFGPENHNGDGLLEPNSIIVVYMDPLGTGPILGASTYEHSFLGHARPHRLTVPKGPYTKLYQGQSIYYVGTSTLREFGTLSSEILRLAENLGPRVSLQGILVPIPKAPCTYVVYT